MVERKQAKKKGEHAEPNAERRIAQSETTERELDECELEDVSAGKVQFQDFHFTKTMDKSST